MNYRGIEIKTDDEVYEPCDDSFLLMDCLEGHIRRGEKVLDMGTGTGILGIFCAKQGASVVCADINAFAVKLARENAKLNSVRIKVVRSDMFEKIAGKFDVIIFNPPYLPTAKQDKIPGVLNYAFDGGKKGNDAIMRFMCDFPKRLAKGGRAYLLLSSLNDIDKILAKLKKEKFSAEKVAERAFDFERLCVYLLRRADEKVSTNPP